MPIRGNADTRLGTVHAGELDGVVLARAGLARIGHLRTVTQVFEPEEMLPAPVQGALAVECRAGEPALAALLGAVTDPASMAAVMAERSLLEALGADCSAPVAACASGAEELRMRAAVMSADGRRVLRAHGATPAARARQLGRDLAAQLLRSGAADLISVNRNGARSPSRLGGLLPSPVRTGLRVGGKVNHRPLPCAALGRDHLDVVNLRRMRPDSSPSASARSPGLIRHLGLSDVTTAHLAEALAITPTEVVPHVDLTVSAVKSMSVLRTSYRVAAMQA